MARHRLGAAARTSTPVDAWLAISHIENSGAAFGVLQGAGTLLLAVTILGIVRIQRNALHRVLLFLHRVELGLGRSR